ncbi:MAG: FtsX-like permease family protein [Streptosporangiales bacterium]|nr:FtsX-like permease family protein [Streptosporangiales bacterium]
MRTIFELSWRLLRGGGRGSLLSTLLTAAAVAVCTGLLMFALGANSAFGQRADADAWRHPVPARDGAALEALSTDSVRGTPISIVDLAARGDAPPVPPGLDHFPEPGEVLVSPALADLMKRLPAEELRDRFPAAPSGLLGKEAVAHPSELVAVVGRSAGDPVMTATREASIGVGLVEIPTPIDSYATGAVSNTTTIYQVLALIASALMVVPLLVFGGAAARLTVARRDQRLAALRLVGATPGQVVGITVAEAVLTAVAGSVVGLLLYAVATPALAQIPIAGGVWFTGDLWPAWWQVAAVLAGVPLLTGLSAVIGLRRVVVTPLGVAARVTPPRMKAVRLLVFAAVLIVFGFVSGGLTGMGTAGAIVLVVLIAFAFLGMNLVGPWVVGLIGRITARVARSPTRLLAGRRLVDDPRAAWRTVAGVVLTGFVAGFLCLMNPGEAVPDSPRGQLQLAVPAAKAPGLAAEARDRLSGTGAKVTISEGPAPDGGSGGRVDDVMITVPGGAGDLDRARAALAGIVPGTVAVAMTDDAANRYLLEDLRTGSLTVLVVSFLIAITSAGITGASAVLDRRQTYAALRLMGTPLTVLNRARRQETLIPLTVMGGGSVLTGLFFAAPFAAGFGAAGAVTMLAFVAVGFAGVLGANALSTPLLRAVTRDPVPQES